MRSLTVKLTLAFVLVGVTGALLVALLVGRQTRTEFDRFLSSRDQVMLVEALGRYYAAQGSWNGVNAMLDRTPLGAYARDIALADAAGVVVRADRGLAVGQQLSRQMLARCVGVSVNGNIVG
ncbi:MAG: two-component sensor histidine kinase, partial [Chloroflexales bacterium]|nr:two-component sensor histidine kinase [Chloroflexales bacterium]